VMHGDDLTAFDEYELALVAFRQQPCHLAPVGVPLLGEHVAGPRLGQFRAGNGTRSDLGHDRSFFTAWAVTFSFYQHFLTGPAGWAVPAGRPTVGVGRSSPRPPLLRQRQGKPPRPDWTGLVAGTSVAEGSVINPEPRPCCLESVYPRLRDRGAAEVEPSQAL